MLDVGREKLSASFSVALLLWLLQSQSCDLFGGSDELCLIKFPCLS